MPLAVFGRGELESEVRLHRNLIGRPETNGSRVRRKQASLGYPDVGTTDPGSKTLENHWLAKN